jgi:serine/threonine-protein kinase
VSTLSLVPGTVIAGKYRLLRHIGDGGMGSVWAVRNEFVDRDFALKLVNPGGGNDSEFRARLLREAKAMGRIQHRNVAEVYDVGQAEDGSPFLVMQLLSGETLEHRLTTKRRLDPDAALAMALDIAKGLGAAHAAGVVHRDLKPANVFLHWDTDHGTVVKVLDFGVSKMLASEAPTGSVTGLAIGSPAYMSPEQARGDKNIDQRSDIWAFGVVLFEMLAGTRPFEGETAYDLVAEILKGEIPDIGALVTNVDPALRGIINKCMVRDRAQRLVTTADLVTELQARVDQRARQHVASSTPGVPVVPRVSSPIRAAEPSSPEIGPTQKIPADPRASIPRPAATLVTPSTPASLAGTDAAVAASGTSTHLTSTRTARSWTKVPRRVPVAAGVVLAVFALGALAIKTLSGGDESAGAEPSTSSNAAVAQAPETKPSPEVAKPTVQPEVAISVSALPMASAAHSAPQKAAPPPTSSPKPRSTQTEAKPRPTKAPSPAPKAAPPPTSKPKKGGLSMPASPG